MTRSFFSAAASGKNFCRHIAAESKFFAGHITQIFIHAVQQFHIRPVQLNAERGKVFLQTLDMRALGITTTPRLICQASTSCAGVTFSRAAASAIRGSAKSSPWPEPSGE